VGMTAIGKLSVSLLFMSAVDADEVVIPSVGVGAISFIDRFSFLVAEYLLDSIQLVCVLVKPSWRKETVN